MKHTLAGLFAVAAIASAATGAQAQSFNCHKADFPDEKLICENQELSALDERLNAIFSRNMHICRQRSAARSTARRSMVIARRRSEFNTGASKCSITAGSTNWRQAGRRLRAFPSCGDAENPEDNAAAVAPVPEPRSARMRRARRAPKSGWGTNASAPPPLRNRRVRLRRAHHVKRPAQRAVRPRR